MHKVKNESDTPPFRPIVSSIGSYNYNLSKFLCNMLTPFIPEQHCTKDTFTFVKELNQVSSKVFFKTLRTDM